MKILGLIGNLFGIGKNYLSNRAKLKEIKLKQEFSIIEAQTKAEVDRILSNTDSDNEIDLITARDKRHGYKDDFITYLFLIPVVVATIIPVLTAYKLDDWINLNYHIVESYNALEQLPDWYKYVLGAIIIDVLGFRSFARKIINKYTK
tara:strand:- start:1041 stop:1484 length:444 start_codon:yes stop_codon:yes gene_type:complete